MKTSGIKKLIKERKVTIDNMNNQIEKWEKHHQNSPYQTDRINEFLGSKDEAENELNELRELLVLTLKYEMEVEG